MSNSDSDVLRMLGSALRVIGICLLAFSGLCTCMIVFPDPWHPPGPSPWSLPTASFLGGLVSWFVGHWLVRRHNRPSTDAHD